MTESDTQSTETASKRAGVGSKVCKVMVVIASAWALIGIWSNVERMAPIRLGKSHEFWQIAAGIDLSHQAFNSMGQVYFIDETTVAYEAQHYHGSEVYSVSRSMIDAQFDTIVARLEQRATQDTNEPAVAGFLAWKNDPDRVNNAEGLVWQIRQARFKALEDEGELVSYLRHVVGSEMAFWQRWRRADWYWANFLFEWLFLTGLVLFLLWPGIRRRSVKRWAMHVALTPLLFMMPVYLGYATYSFTTRGPSGGIYYPFLLQRVRGGTMNAFDQWLCQHTPQILEPMSTPIGEWMVLSGRGMPGPTSALFVGVVAGVGILAVRASRSQSPTD